MSEPFSDEELAELAALTTLLVEEPGVREGLRQRRRELAEHAITQVVLALRNFELMADDDMTVIKRMTEVTIWATELYRSSARELLAAGRPRHTTGQFSY